MGELCYGYQDVIRVTGISRTFDPGQIRDQTKIENIGFQTSYDSAVYVGVWTPKRGIKMATNV